MEFKPVTEKSPISDERAANTWNDVHIKRTAMYSVCPIIRAKEWIQHSTQAETKLHQWLINRPNREIQLISALMTTLHAVSMSEYFWKLRRTVCHNSEKTSSGRTPFNSDWLHRYCWYGGRPGHDTCFFKAHNPRGPVLHSWDFTITLTHTAHWVGHPWTRDQLVADNTKHTRQTSMSPAGFEPEIS
jgi:hypothetical protein